MTEDELRQTIRQEMGRFMRDIEFEYTIVDAPWLRPDAIELPRGRDSYLRDLLNNFGKEGYRLAGYFPDIIGIPILLLVRARPGRQTE